MAVSDYSTSAGGNTALFAEGQSPASLNDGTRQVQADIRAAFNDLPWFNLGNGTGTPAYTYVSSTSFSLPGNVTSIYHQYRAIRAVGDTTGTIYGKISSSSHSAGVTTVVVEWNSGSLQSETLTISLGIPAIGPPFAYANTTQLVAGTSSSLVVTPQKMAQLTGPANPGFIRYPGGIIMQFGTGTTNGSGVLAVSYPQAYSTIGMPICAAAGTPFIHVQASDLTVNGFTATSYVASGAVSNNNFFIWHAFGC